MLMCMQNLVRFCCFQNFEQKLNFVVKILRKMRGNTPKLDLVNADVDTTLSLILSICFQDIEWKQKFDVDQGS